MHEADRNLRLCRRLSMEKIRKSSSSSFHPKGVGGAGGVWWAFC